MTEKAVRRSLHQLWVIVREHASGWLVGGAIIALTGFAPEHWFGEALKAIHLPDWMVNAWPTSIDARLAVVSLGIAIIVGDVLLRRRALEPNRSEGSVLSRATESATSDRPLALPDKPSIAVLPFANLSGDSEQEYFADGMVEDIITALSRLRWLFVIARNSSFTYKGRAVDVKLVGRELGVRYVVEGGVRKMAGRVRITTQLIDASTGAHLWADRFEGALENVFELQDQVTASIAGAIAPNLERAEIERVKHKPTENLDAYDYYLRGMQYFYSWTKASNAEALRLFYKAIELDPNFALALSVAGYCYLQRKTNGWMEDRSRETAEGVRLAARAVELGRDDALVLARAGSTLVYLVGDVEGAAAAIDKAIALNPNLAGIWINAATLKLSVGEPELAIEYLTRAKRLSPLDPAMFAIYGLTAAAYFFAGRTAEALPLAQKSLHENPNYVPGLRMAAAAYAIAGRQQEAEQAAARLLQLTPALRLSNLKDYIPYRRPADLARLTDGLRKAGLPE